MPAPIMVGVDGSPAALAAVDWAADDAGRRSSELRLVHVVEPHMHDASRRGETLLSNAAERARAAGVAVATELADGLAHEVLVERAGDGEVLVLGSRGLGGFTGLLLGSVSLRVAGHAAGPVVVVREPQGDVEAAGEIVAGFDGSDESQVALEYAFEEAKLRGLRPRRSRVAAAGRARELRALRGPERAAPAVVIMQNLSTGRASWPHSCGPQATRSPAAGFRPRRPARRSGCSGP